MNTKFKKYVSVMATTGALAWLPVNAEAVTTTTNLDFAGGCPGAHNSGSLCGSSGQASDENVAAILGVDVTEIFHTDVNNSIISGIGGASGTWDLGANLEGITHLAFKSDGYFVLAEVTANSGTWANWGVDNGPVTGGLAWGTDVSIQCPATICLDGGDYKNLDFTNGGTNVAALSNVRGYSVVPVPAAVWLFGSGLLGLVGVARRKRA